MSHAAKTWTALVTVYVVWGSTYLGIAITRETIPSLFAASTRFIVAGALMAIIVRARGGSLRIPARELATCLLVGCLLPVANAVVFFAEGTVSTGLASLLIATVPLWIVLFRVAARESLPRQLLAGVAIGFAGVAVLAQPSGSAKLGGIALCVLSAMMWATGSVISARLKLPDDPFTATTYEMLGGGLLMLVPSLFTLHHFSPSAGSIGGWTYLVVVGSIVAYNAYAWLLSNAPLGLVSTYAYVNPVVAITLGVLFHGEHLSWRLLTGAAVVVAAVALVVRREPAGRTRVELEADVVRRDRDAVELAAGRRA